MAKSANYYGLRRGSTKSHTYSVLDGKQITKDRVEGGKDPRTLAQMSQRCMVTTIGVAYAAMKSICDHSFEEKSAGMQCMREFMSSNLKLLQLSKEYDNGFFGFDEENAAEEPAHEQSQYFTYETITPEDRKGRKAARMVEVPEEEQREAAFDLRQAVIYQTVLNNPYINTGNQINQ